MEYTIGLKVIDLKEAVEELDNDRTVFYTYSHKEDKAIWPVTKELIQYVLFKSILEKDELIFLMANTFLEEKE